MWALLEAKIKWIEFYLKSVNNVPKMADGKIWVGLEKPKITEIWKIRAFVFFVDKKYNIKLNFLYVFIGNKVGILGSVMNVACVLKKLLLSNIKELQLRTQLQ